MIVLAFWVFTISVFAFTFLTGNAALQMRLAGLGSVALYLVCVVHAVLVR